MRYRTILLSAAFILGLSVLAALPVLAANPEPSSASAIVAPITDAAGAQLGMAAVADNGDGTTRLTVLVSGLTPGSHGIHIHESGNCDPAGEKAYSGAGGHFNPDGAVHANHAGDFANLLIDTEGDGLFVIDTDQVTLGDGGHSLLDADGSALIIHADEDDLKTDPSGNSGGRIACAVLAAAR